MMTKDPIPSKGTFSDTDTHNGLAGTPVQQTGTNLRHGTMSAVSHNLFWLTAPQRTVEQEAPATSSVVCFSPIRWDSPRRRPQHLMSRCVDGRRVFYVEEPVYGAGSSPWLDISERECGVWVVVPYMPEGMSREQAASAQKGLLADLFEEFAIDKYILWYYAPEALRFTRHLRPLATIYDRMNELAGTGQPEGAEAELIGRADLVFTESPIPGVGHGVEASKIHLSPESLDRDHFMQAREAVDEPFEQSVLPYPRIGYHGPIDERIDLDLLDAVARARPDWQFVLIGTVEGVDVSDLLQHRNVHLLSGKEYEEIPYYMAGWNVAMLPYRQDIGGNRGGASTALEYLAAGRPVVATCDVLRPFSSEKLVCTAETLAEFIITAAESGMDDMLDNSPWLRRADKVLARLSWDRTWGKMMDMVEMVAGRRHAVGNIRQVQPINVAGVQGRG